MKFIHRRSKAPFVREIVFGLEDSLVSTLGAVTGIAAGSQSQYLVILSGVVIIAVESISMAAGTYLSSKAAFEAKESSLNRPIMAGLIMLVAYVFGGLFPLAPYLFLPVGSALIPSIAATIIVLFLTGVWKARTTNQPAVRSGLEMMIVSGLAAALGYLIGHFFSQITGITV